MQSNAETRSPVEEIRTPVATADDHLRIRTQTDAGENSTAAVRDRITHATKEVSWVELGIGIVMGVGIGLLVRNYRRPDTLGSICSDSLKPWASRNVHEMFDHLRHSRPVHALRSQLGKS